MVVILLPCGSAVHCTALALVWSGRVWFVSDAPKDKAKYKSWVLEYLSAWEQRAYENDGILPDNVGPSGKIGECMPNGEWWGGYYGYRWPHGIMNSQVRKHNSNKQQQAATSAVGLHYPTMS
jgi:hypothetical protein